MTIELTEKEAEYIDLALCLLAKLPETTPKDMRIVMAVSEKFVIKKDVDK